MLKFASSVQMPPRSRLVIAMGLTIWMCLSWTPILAQDETWRSSGPFCSSVDSLATAPSTTDVSYLASGARLFRSDNGWQTWQELHADDLNFSINGELAFDPRNPLTVFAVVDGDAQRSDDGGETFSLLPDPLSQLFGTRHIWFVPTESPSLFVYAWFSLYRSTDMGQTWVDVSLESGDHPQNLMLHPSRSESLWTTNFRGIWRSDDLGTSWRSITEGFTDFPTITAFSMDPVNPEIAYLIEDAELFVTTDGGTQWQSKGRVPVSTSAPEALASLGGGVLVISDSTGLLVSDDGGDTWGVTGLEGEEVDSLEWLPDVGMLLATTSRGFAVSEDQGVTWRWPDQGINQSGISNLTWKGEFSSTLLTGYCGGRVARSDDGGLTWQRGAPLQPSSSINAIGVDPHNTDRIFAGGSASGVYISQDGGDSWIFQQITQGFLNLNLRQIVVHPEDDHRIIASSSDGIYLSRDGGATWQNILPEVSVSAMAIDPADTDVIILNSGWRSGDRGDTWSQGDGFPTLVNELIYDRFVRGQIYAGDTRFNTGLHRSRDGGITWQPLENSPVASTNALAQDSDGNLWLSVRDPELFSDKLFRSSDGGLTWQRHEDGILQYRNSNGEPPFYNVLATNSAGGVAVGTSPFGVYRLGDGPDCIPGDTVACLLDGQFQVTGTMETLSSPPTTVTTRIMQFPTARAESDQAVFFESFQPGNFEVGVKMVDACVLPDGHPLRAFWAFFGGLTNAEATIEIQDSSTGQIYRWENPRGDFALSLGDTAAFPCEVDDASPTVPCFANDTTACLLAERFRVTGEMVGFDDPPTTVPVQVMSFTGGRAESDQAVFFESFQEGNFEVGVKMVDACSLPEGHPLRAYWVFYGGLSNAATHIRVTQTSTGEVDEWINEAGNFPRSEGRTQAFSCDP